MNDDIVLNRGRLRAVGLTFDIDWAPDYVLQPLLQRLTDAQVQVTLFVTHRTSLLDGLDPTRFELALHPNLQDSLSLGQTLAPLRDYLPNANGVRFHRLVQSTPLLGELGQAGLLYDASQLVPYQPHLQPYTFPPPLVRIPYHWEDDVHAMGGRPWTHDHLGLGSEGLKIFDFHPIHVFLNSQDLSRYKAAKAIGFEPSGTAALRNPGAGTAEALEILLARIQNEAVQTYRLQELAQAVRAGQITDGCRP